MKDMNVFRIVKLVLINFPLFNFIFSRTRLVHERGLIIIGLLSGTEFTFGLGCRTRMSSKGPKLHSKPQFSDLTLMHIKKPPHFSKR